MAEDESKIKIDIQNYINQNHGNSSEWYVGVAEKPRERLFKDHNVDERKDPWIYENTGSREIADRIEKYFTQTVGVKGGPGGGNENSTYVYAYRIGPNTKQ